MKSAEYKSEINTNLKNRTQIEHKSEKHVSVAASEKSYLISTNNILISTGLSIFVFHIYLNKIII